MSTDLEAGRASVEIVGRFMETEFRRGSPFHLASCGGCGAPSFQQPCPICNYYPMGADKGTWSPKQASKDLFVHAIESSGPGHAGGNIATWALRAIERSSMPNAKERIRPLLDKASMLDLLPADRIWDVVVEQGEFLNRLPRDGHVSLGWTGVEELQNAAGRAAGIGRLDARTCGEMNDAIDAWIEAVHAEDLQAIGTATRNVNTVAKHVAQATGGSGNLVYARDQLERAVDIIDARLAEAAPGMK